jgi:membrane protein implicated in regulation of membrane protease activity
VPLVIGTSIFIGLIFFGILLFAIRAQKTPIRMGQESLVGRTGMVRRTVPVRSASASTGIVQLGGEQWTAELADGEDSLPQGTLVVVERVEGLRLIVRKVK